MGHFGWLLRDRRDGRVLHNAADGREGCLCQSLRRARHGRHQRIRQTQHASVGREKDLLERPPPPGAVEELARLCRRSQLSYSLLQQEMLTTPFTLTRADCTRTGNRAVPHAVALLSFFRAYMSVAPVQVVTFEQTSQGYLKVPRTHPSD